MVSVACLPVAWASKTAELPGGRYLRALVIGDPPAVYDRIGLAMQALTALAPPGDPDRPLVEYYRRHNELEL